MLLLHRWRTVSASYTGKQHHQQQPANPQNPQSLFSGPPLPARWTPGFTVKDACHLALTFQRLSHLTMQPLHLPLCPCFLRKLCICELVLFLNAPLCFYTCGGCHFSYPILSFAGWICVHQVLVQRGVCMCSVTQSCLTLSDPMDCSPPGSSVCAISQSRMLEWVAISYSRGSFWPRDRTSISGISCIGRQIFYHWAIWEASWQTVLPLCFHGGRNALVFPLYCTCFSASGLCRLWAAGRQALCVAVCTVGGPGGHWMEGGMVAVYHGGDMKKCKKESEPMSFTAQDCVIDFYVP